ncbi:MAG TPA: DUF1343 domain-containing protein [Nitrospina sp.]|jgi:uncharacterized protein YbbC (DUF1343 family)|nr:DUF1343 domain-containing protein [Nitrospina sp.]
MTRTVSGIDHLLSQPEKYLQGKTVGLIVNHTSLAGDGKHSITHFLSHSAFTLQALFAPEHGLNGTAQDMIPIDNEVDLLSGLDIKSLYGKNKDSLVPDPALLHDIDNLVFDIQDIGSRYYTFIYTMANCMIICKQAGTRMVVCDRPNPINGTSVEGNLVGEAWRSFVGQYPLPNRHGMTVGELARLFNEHFGIHCDLTVVPMSGWSREMWYDQTGMIWTPPSPNMPTLATATVYPGMCLIEGTLLSEGRGTTLPFEQIGAPFIDPHKLVARLETDSHLLPGVFFRPQYFKPMFQKHAGEVCAGLQLHITDRDQFKPLLTTLALLRAIAEIYPDQLQWRTEPYEFVSDRLAIDLLYGNPKLRETIFTDSFSLPALEEREELSAFLPLRQEYLIYS